MPEVNELADELERECSDLHCEHPYGPCCGAVERNNMRRMAREDRIGEGLLIALRQDVGDEIVEEMEAGFEGERPLSRTLAFIAALRQRPDDAVVEAVERAIELRRYLYGGEPLNPNERGIVEGIRTAVLAALSQKDKGRD